MTVTPLNFLRYNWKQENLAVHGIHSRWTHLFVNFPLLFGPLTIFPIWKLDRRNWMDVVIMMCIGCSLLFLSVVPHQEARFLLPLIMPMALLSKGRLFSISSERLWLWIRRAWLLFNAVMVLFYGCIHQAGVIPATHFLHDIIQTSPEPTHLIYFHTYMPPQHLLCLPENSTITVHDLAGSELRTLEELLHSIDHGTVYIVCPATITLSVDRLILLKQFGPHFSGEDPPWDEGVSFSGIFQKLQLNVFLIQPS